MIAPIASSNVSGASDIGFSRSRFSGFGSFVAGTRELLALDFFVATAAFSAFSDDGIEDVAAVPVVVAEGKLVEVQGKVVLADVVERADNAALQQRPERIEVGRVDGDYLGLGTMRSKATF